MAEATFDYAPDSNTLPIFYYNDLMVSKIGDQIGLNLFEPRYKEMCRRMMQDPRMLFMPNFENYECRIGDVGFVMRLTSMQDRGQAFAISAVAEEVVVVDCSWVEPRSHRLHFAQFFRLPPQIQSLTVQEAQSVYSSLQSLGWMHLPMEHTSPCLVHKDMEGTHLLVSQNCGGKFYLLLQTRDPEAASRHVQQALQSCTSTSVNSSSLSRLLYILPNSPMSVGLSGVLDQLRDLFCSEGIEPYAATKMALRFPSDLRLCGIGDVFMRAYFPTATLTFSSSEPPSFSDTEAPDLIGESLPYLTGCLEYMPDFSRAVKISSGTSHFFAPISECRVTVESAEATVGALVWRLNSLRLCILQHARKTGQGPLAALKDDAARLVCNFIASEPECS